MYDDIYRVPLIVRWPGVIEPGRNNALVYNMDMGAAMWELAGEAVPAGASARSLFSVLVGERQDLGRDVLICEFYRQWDFYSQGMAHSGTEKFIYNFSDTDEYYDLTADPHEMDNRIAEPAAAERVAWLSRRLHEWMKGANSYMTHGFERTSAAKINFASLAWKRGGPAAADIHSEQP